MVRSPNGNRRGALKVDSLAQTGVASRDTPAQVEARLPQLEAQRDRGVGGTFAAECRSRPRRTEKLVGRRPIGVSAVAGMLVSSPSTASLGKPPRGQA